MGKYLSVFFIGVFLGSVAVIHLTEEFYREDIVTLEECTINKPSGTACIYEGGYIAKEVK